MRESSRRRRSSSTLEDIISGEKISSSAKWGELEEDRMATSRAIYSSVNLKEEGEEETSSEAVSTFTVMPTAMTVETTIIHSRAISSWADKSL